MLQFFKRRIAFAPLLLLGCLAGRAQSNNPTYNKVLADSLGSDAYGMKQYVLVILKTGTAVINDKAVRDSLFNGHMANIDQLAAAGKLIVAGPLQKNERNYRGIFIFNVPSVEAARALVASDPAVKAGIFDTELFSWYGSAALPLYLPYHSQLQQKKM